MIYRLDQNSDDTQNSKYKTVQLVDAESLESITELPSTFEYKLITRSEWL